jgi:hypothetical protein
MRLDAKSFVEEAWRTCQDPAQWMAGKPAELAQRTVEEWRGAPPAELAEFLTELLEAHRQKPDFATSQAVKKLVDGLMRKPVALSEEQVLRMLGAMKTRMVLYPYKSVLRSVEGIVLTGPLRTALEELRASIDPHYIGAGEAKEIWERIDSLLGYAKPKGVEAAGDWSRRVMEETRGSEAWANLIAYWPTLTQSEASQKWMQGAVALVDKVGRDGFRQKAAEWLQLPPMMEERDRQVPEPEAEYQKGFVWTVGAMGDISLAGGVADFAVACYRKIPHLGAVSQRVGNACVNALAVMPGVGAVAHLSRLSQRVKYDVALRLIEKALAGAAARNGMSREDLEAMSVPTFGLDVNGVRVERMGDCEAILSATPEGARLDWRKGGKNVKSAPAEAKKDYADAVKGLKKVEKELDAMVGAQRRRLESLLLARPETAFAQWKAWYIDHPVVGIFGRRLIWEVLEEGKTAQGIWRDGKLVDWAGGEVAVGEGGRVRLWHPVEADPQTVLSWRCWLEDHEVKQPFKQAHREVYLLTEAERRTGTYSNRFAAHILRQHPFAALCRERGWQFTLMGQWDSHNNAVLDLPRFGMRVEYFLDFPGNEEASGHGIYLVISTDQVRFWRGPEELRLEEVPPLVFSEVMRDVDLFVGVTSIGSDPAWGAGHREYWTEFAFGELSASAENRREILERLLPKLAIRDKCRLEGRFLHVHGKLQEYKIHLGSGNILIEPGSRYLCIVQGPGDSADRVFLPFDGDRTLAGILSKAFLLVNDDKITDETITRQLRAA